MNHLFINNKACWCFHCGAVEKILPNDLAVGLAHLLRDFERTHKFCVISKAGAELFLKSGPAPVKDTAAKLKAAGKGGPMMLRIGSTPKYFLKGSELRKWRLAIPGLTLRSLANKLDISAAYLSKVESTDEETCISDGLYSRIEALFAKYQAETE